MAAYGIDRGREATAEALAYAWEHWPALRELDNPAGYLYRVGQSRSRPRRVPRIAASDDRRDLPWVEPKLLDALTALTEPQRVAVVLAKGHEWQLHEIASLTGVSVSTVQTHLERGLAKLRLALGVEEEHGRPR